MKVIARTVFFSKYYNSLDVAMQKKVKKAIIEMRKVQSLRQLTSVIKMKNSTYYRKRIGDYRLLFEWDREEQQIVLYKIELRKDVYE
jgi:mRNA-degrading endonuclease RelE of RelBE toxin-antitoxin system